ncbi:hypothetical protein CNMCM6805_000660 [Aspergillus fumigatiaffinis]|uniref:Uncharacterized protein n=1 Tax=Aspergillus fumigatiaffinis TaxID=340414 RepID=A0A8H4GXA6_9EURO|nr:hypothetical protein CNMCM6805_000660 [Aspergillus fumigatiaffinis]
MSNLRSSVSAQGRNDEAPKLEDYYFETYSQAWPFVEKLLWGEEVERDRARNQMRRVNSAIEKLNRKHGKRPDRCKINIEKYLAIGERLLNAAIRSVTDGDDSEYNALREKYNNYFRSQRFPDTFCISDEKFNALRQSLEPLVQKTREEYSSELSDVPDEEHIDAEQDNDRREELENAYTRAGLSDHGSSSAEEHGRQNPDVEPGDQSDEHHDRYDDDGYDDDGYDDDGFFDQSPPNPSRKDRGFWETHYVAFDDLLHDTQKVWGSLMTEGEILAYRLQGNVGYSVIVGYECDGRQIARLEAAARRPIPKDAQHISEISKARKPIYEDKNRKFKEYRNRADVQGIGLVAWRVEGNYETDPTSVLRPSRKAWYPETYIQVYWTDNSWSWESRDGLRFVYGGDSYRVDILIYRQAISQEADFQEALTGHRPEFPDGGPMANKHWRNENAYGGAFWLQPRARKNKRVVKIEEEGVENVKSEDEDGLWDPAENGATQPFADGLEASGDPPQGSPDAPSNWERADYDPLMQNINTERNFGGDSRNMEAFERRQGALPHRLRTGNIAHTQRYQGSQDRRWDSAHTRERNSATHQTPYESRPHRNLNSAPPERRRFNPGPSRRSPTVDAPRTQQRNIDGFMDARRANSEATPRSGPPNGSRTLQGYSQGLHGSSARRNPNAAPLRMQASTTPRGDVPLRASNIRERHNHQTGTARQSERHLNTPHDAQERDTNTPRLAASQHRASRNAPSSPMWGTFAPARQASDPSSTPGIIRNRGGGTTPHFPGRQKRPDILASSGRVAPRGGPQVQTRRNEGSSSRSAQTTSEGRRRVKVV